MKPGTVILLQADTFLHRHKPKIWTFITLTSKGEVICLEERMSIYKFITSLINSDAVPLSLILDLNLQIEQLEWLSRTSLLDKRNFSKLIKKLLKFPISNAKSDNVTAAIKEVLGRAASDDLYNIFSDLEIAIALCHNYSQCLSTGKRKTIEGFFRLKVAAGCSQYEKPLKLLSSC